MNKDKDHVVLNASGDRDKWRELKDIHYRAMICAQDASDRLEIIITKMNSFETGFHSHPDKELLITTVQENVKNIRKSMKSILTEVEVLESKFIKDQTVEHLHLIFSEQLGYLNVLCSDLPILGIDNVVFGLDEQRICAESSSNAKRLMNEAIETIKIAISFQSAKAERDRLNVVVKGLQEEILMKDKKLNQTMKELEDQCKTMTALMKERDIFAAEQERYDSLDETFKILVEGSDILKCEIETLSLKLSNVEEQCNEYENKIVVVTKDKENISRAMDAVLVERNALANQLKDCQYIIKEIGDLQFYAQNYEKIASDRDELILKLKQLEERVTNLEEYKAKYEELCIIDKDVRLDNNRLNVTLKNQQDEINACQKTIDEQNSKIRQLKTNLAAINTEMQNQHLAILNMISESEKKDEQLKKFKEELSNIESLRDDINSMECDLVSSLEDAISQREVLENDITILKKKENELISISQYLIELFQVEGFDHSNEINFTLENTLIKFIYYLKENKLHEEKLNAEKVNSLVAHLEELFQLDGFEDTNETYCSIEEKFMKYMEYKKENMSEKKEIKVLKLPHYYESGSSTNDETLPDFDKIFDEHEKSGTGSDVSEVNAERLAAEYKEIQTVEAILCKKNSVAIGNELYLNAFQFTQTREAMEIILAAMIAVLTVREYFNCMIHCTKSYVSSSCKFLDIGRMENGSSSNVNNGDVEIMPLYNSPESSSKYSGSIYKDDSNFKNLHNNENGKSNLYKTSTNVKLTENNELCSGESSNLFSKVTDVSNTTCTNLKEQVSSVLTNNPMENEFISVNTPLRRTKSYVIQRHAFVSIETAELEEQCVENNNCERYPTYYNFNSYEMINDQNNNNTELKKENFSQSEKSYVAPTCCVIFSNRSNEECENENVCIKPKEDDQLSHEFFTEEDLKQQDVSNVLLQTTSKIIDLNISKDIDSNSVFENRNADSMKKEFGLLQYEKSKYNIKLSLSSPELLYTGNNDISDDNIQKRKIDVNGSDVNLRSHDTDSSENIECEKHEKDCYNEKESIDTDLKDIDEKLEIITENTTSTQVGKGISYEKVVEAVIESLAKDSIDIISDYFYKGFVRYKENKLKYGNVSMEKDSNKEQELYEYESVSESSEEANKCRIQCDEDKYKGFPEILTDIEIDVLNVMREDQLPSVDLSEEKLCIEDVAKQKSIICSGLSPEYKSSKSITVEELSNIELMLTVLSNYKQIENESKAYNNKHSESEVVQDGVLDRSKMVNNLKIEGVLKSPSKLMNNNIPYKSTKFGNKLTKRYSGYLVKNTRRNIDETGFKTCKSKSPKIILTDNIEIIDGNVVGNYVNISKSSAYSQKLSKTNSRSVDKGIVKHEHACQIDEVKRFDNKVTRRYINISRSTNESKSQVSNTELLNKMTVTKMAKEENKLTHENMEQASPYVIKSCKRISSSKTDALPRKTYRRKQTKAKPETFTKENSIEINLDMVDKLTDRPQLRINKKQVIAKFYKPND